MLFTYIKQEGQMTLGQGTWAIVASPCWIPGYVNMLITLERTQNRADWWVRQLRLQSDKDPYFACSLENASQLERSP